MYDCILRCASRVLEVIPMSPEKGFVFSLEALVVGIGWLLLLSFLGTWIFSHVLSAREAQATDFLDREAIRLSDQLILAHSTNPWNGCAFFSIERQRVISRNVSESCLRQLSSLAPEIVSEITLVQQNEKKILFSREHSSSHCSFIRRLIRLRPSNALAALEVRVCA